MNIAIELWGSFFCLLGFVSTCMFERIKGRRRLTLQALFILEFLATAGDALAGIYRGEPGEVAWFATHVGNLVPFCSSFMLGAVFTTFLVERIAPRNDLAHKWEIAVWALSICSSMAAVCGAFYTIDPATNLYHRLPTFWISVAAGIIVDFGDLVLLVIQWDYVPRHTRFVMFTYILLPIPLLVLHSLQYGLNYTIIATVSAMFLFFLEMQSSNAQLIANQRISIARQERELAEKERSLTESRISSMVSQIQPHFLYNTLDSIYFLCTDDPEAAADAVNRFSDYLRGNLGSLKQSKPIPIEQELEHVRNYLDLEVMSAYDTLSYTIDAPVAGFFIPALTVQPLAENAVKHGVSKKRKGGTVNIKTSETDTHFVVQVIDNGVGFDPSQSPGDDRVHLGIESVRDRVKAMCDGTLDIQSTPGVGTTATIRIPKSRKNTLGEGDV